MTVGSVLEQTLGLYQRFFWRFVAITALVMTALDFAVAVAIRASTDSTAFAWWVVAIVIGLIGTFWVQGALAFAVADVRDGRADSPIGELFSRTRGMLGILIGAGVLAAVGIGFGLVLLIAPGLYLLARWAVIVPAIVIEKRGVGEAFARSNELTVGHRWKVLGVALVTSLASGIIGAIASALVNLVLPGLVGVWLGQLAADCITVPFVAVAFTVMYFSLVRATSSDPAIDPAAA